MVQFLSRAWRGDLAGVVSSAGRSLLIAAPYIKYDEAAWLCELLHPGIEVVTLANIESSAAPDARRKFAEAMRQARPLFASTQVGSRSAYAVFGEAIRFLLASGPQTTKAMQQAVSRLMPVLCDDREYLFIKGERYGKAWKRRFRHAQLRLKRKGVISYSPSTKTWALVRR